MKSLLSGCAVLMASLVLVATSTHASVRSQYDAFDLKIHAELQATSPAAEILFAQADSARAAGDHLRAVELYTRVVAMAPGFVHALRRLGEEQAALGQRPEAIATLQQAVGMSASADNLTALAGAIMLETSDAKVNFVDAQRAQQLVERAVALEPGNVFAWTERAEIAYQQRDLPALDAAVARLDSLAPEEIAPHFLGAVAAASHGKFTQARAELDRAHARGLPDATYRAMTASIERAEPKLPRVLAWGGMVAAIWLASGIVILAIGFVLSALTLHACERPPASAADAVTTPLDAFVRRSYQAILWICCAYYYVSMPILLGLVLFVGGGLIYGLLTLGSVPIKLLIIIAITTLVTAWAILKSLLVRAKETDPGVRLDLAGEPALRRTLETVASRVGTPPVDAVFLTPATDVAVFERGGMLRQLQGRPERCLVLGVGVLDGFRMRPFRAVLAHEYGHLSNRDTAGGGFALAVRRSVVTLGRRLAESGAAGWYNPAWLFVNGFYRLFLRLSQGASRLQEVLADRWAATLYGAQAFEDGLRHVIERGVRFDNHVGATLKEVVEGKRPLANLYRYSPAQTADADKVDEGVREQIERAPSPYDSHPRPLDRFRWVHALGAPGQAEADDDAPAWDLFADRTAIEELMTNQVRAAVAHNHGIEIAPGA